MPVPPLSVNGQPSSSASSSFDVAAGPIEPHRVLSIQSHVVSGYVGNKAATFPLQLLGWDVDAVNTVQFSNHTGYGHTAGTKTSADDLRSIFGGLRSNGLLKGARLLTGYIPGGEAVSVVAELAKELNDQRANEGHELIYVLDPVLGDHGTLYVAESVIPIYRSLLPLATIITPNQFEAETLANQKITSLSTLRSLLLTLHKTYHLPHIIISSFSLPSSATTPDLPAPPQAYQTRFSTSPTAQPLSSYPTLLSVSSTYDPTTSSLSTTLFSFPLIPGYFSGVGDLFSSLTLAHYSPTSPGGLAKAASKALYSTQMVLLSTHLHAEAVGEDEGSDGEKDAEERGRRVRRMRGRELRVVGRGARADLEGGGEWEGKSVELPKE